MKRFITEQVQHDWWFVEYVALLECLRHCHEERCHEEMNYLHVQTEVYLKNECQLHSDSIFFSRIKLIGIHYKRFICDLINSIRTPMLIQGKLERTETNVMHYEWEMT